MNSSEDEKIVGMEQLNEVVELEDAGEEDEEESHGGLVAVATEDTIDAGARDEESATQTTGKDDDEEMKSVVTIKSELTQEDDDEVSQTKKESMPPKKSPKRKAQSSAKKARSPAVKGLHIPFRSVKRTMKLDPAIETVQNEAAIVTTMAAELFLKNLAKESLQTAKSHGRNTIRYEDVAEARTKDPALSFLDILMP